MTTRSQWHEIELPADPLTVFNLLLGQKTIRGRWGSVAAIAAELDGFWVLAWGARENDPDYVMGTKIKAFESPRRVLLVCDYARAKSGLLPYGAGMTAEFTIQKAPVGSLLRVTHAGFPQGKEADAHYSSAGEGWRAVLQGIGVILAPPPKR